MIRFGSDTCNQLEDALSREWLETNSLGGFASGTIAGAHTRRYHGLLIATTEPSVRRNLLLSKIDETFTSSEGLSSSAVISSAAQFTPKDIFYWKSFA